MEKILQAENLIKTYNMESSKGKMLKKYDKESRKKGFSKKDTFSFEVQNSPQINLRKPKDLLVLDSTKESMKSPMFNLPLKSEMQGLNQIEISPMLEKIQEDEESESIHQSSGNSLRVNRKLKSGGSKDISKEKKVSNLKNKLRGFDEAVQSPGAYQGGKKKVEISKEDNKQKVQKKAAGKLLDESFASSESEEESQEGTLQEGRNIGTLASGELVINLIAPGDTMEEDPEPEQRRVIEEDLGSSFSSSDDIEDESFIEENLLEEEPNDRVICLPPLANENSINMSSPEGGKKTSICESLKKIERKSKEKEESHSNGNTSVSFIRLIPNNVIKPHAMLSKNIEKMNIRSVNDTNLSAQGSIDPSIKSIVTPRNQQRSKLFTFCLDSISKEKAKSGFSFKNEIKTCDICKGDINDAQVVACFAICEHVFHEQCLFELIDNKEFRHSDDPEAAKVKKNEKDGLVFCPHCHQL